jgi:hypothetical protein
MLHTEMPWYAKLGTAILAITIGGGCIIAILLALPIGLVWDLGNWRDAAHHSRHASGRIEADKPGHDH